MSETKLDKLADAFPDALGIAPTIERSIALAVARIIVDDLCREMCGHCESDAPFRIGVTATTWWHESQTLSGCIHCDASIVRSCLAALESEATG